MKNIFGYSFATFVSILVLLCNLFLYPVIGPTPLFLFFTFAVLLSAFYGGFNASLLSAAILSFGAVYISSLTKQPVLMQSTFLIDFSLFVISSILISFFIGRKKTFREKQSNARARKAAIYDASLDAIVIVDKKGKIIEANKAAGKVFGFPVEQIIGKKLDTFIFSSILAKDEKESIHTYLQNNSIDRFEKRIEMSAKHASGSHLPVDLTFTQVTLREGTFYPVFLHDITERKKKEEEYTELLRREREARSQALEAIQMRDEFLSIASHELKTPLTSMLLQLQSVLHNIRHVSLANFSIENLLKMLESTERQSNRLSKMINDLLNISLITTGRLDLELEETNLTILVKDVIDNFSEKLEKEGYIVSFEAEENVQALVDKLRIEQVITNLLSNAIKYGNNNPINMRLEKGNGVIRFSIKDHGIGILQDKQQQIFARFERAVSDRSYKGLGVGLYISSQIIASHNGKVTVESVPNEGSTFIIELPIRN